MKPSKRAAKSSKIYEVILTLPSGDNLSADILREVLCSAGFSLEEIVESVQGSTASFSLYASTLKDSHQLERLVKKLRLKQVSVRKRSLKGSDWQTRWKEEFQPFPLTKTYTVVPAWQKETYRKRGNNCIYIDSHLSFGTGLHPTTQFMSVLIERCAGRFDSFLDIGTGTGILAILAYKHGARQICAIDITQDCVSCAQSNFQLNHIPVPHIEVCDFSSYRQSTSYDFVAANLVSCDLMKMGDKLVQCVKPGQYLAISGISMNHYRSVRNFFKAYPLRCLKIERGQGWNAILFKKHS
jgi:ribosomal protein L11 methyltransferase